MYVISGHVNPLIVLVALLFALRLQVSGLEFCHDTFYTPIALTCDSGDQYIEPPVIVIDNVYFGVSVSWECINKYGCTEAEASWSVHHTLRTLCDGKIVCSDFALPYDNVRVGCVAGWWDEYFDIADYARITYHCTKGVEAPVKPTSPTNVTSPTTSVTSVKTKSPTTDTSIESRTEAMHRDSITKTLVLPIVLSFIGVLVLIAVIVLAVKCSQRRKQRGHSRSDNTASGIQMALPRNLTPSAPPVEPNIYEISLNVIKTPDNSPGVDPLPETSENNNNMTDVYTQAVPRSRRENYDTAIQDNPTYLPFESS